MAATGRKRGVSIYRATDAVYLGETDFMTAPETPPPVRSLGANAATGGQVKVLVRDAGGFSLVHVWFKANYPLPRHSHNVDCMYYVISGSAVMGNRTLRAGDSFFVPADAPYQYTAGPEGVEVLEVRHGAEQFDIKLSNTDVGPWEAFAAAVEAHQEEWERTPVSPTFAANASR
jgi:mannose-6-phosphate isomerase-like protein (cupin superfamily)